MHTWHNAEPYPTSDEGGGGLGGEGGVGGGSHGHEFVSTALSTSTSAVPGGGVKKGEIGSEGVSSVAYAYDNNNNTNNTNNTTTTTTGLGLRPPRTCSDATTFPTGRFVRVCVAFGFGGKRERER